MKLFKKRCNHRWEQQPSEMIVQAGTKKATVKEFFTCSKCGATKVQTTKGIYKN